MEFDFIGPDHCLSIYFVIRSFGNDEASLFVIRLYNLILNDKRNRLLFCFHLTRKIQSLTINDSVYLTCRTQNKGVFTETFPFLV